MSELAALVRDFREIQSDLAILTAKVEQLRIRVKALDFELVDTPESAPAAASAAGSVLGSTGSHSDPVREQAAIETGEFFLRCLEGKPRGDSGRSKVRLQNRLYVVVKTFKGEIHTKPVIVLEKYSQVKRLVCHPDCDSFGDSIFCGFPSKWEAQLAVATAGFRWP